MKEKINIVNQIIDIHVMNLITKRHIHISKTGLLLAPKKIRKTMFFYNNGQIKDNMSL